ncbi:MAG: ATP-dependent nuclease [Emergencia sp.]
MIISELKIYNFRQFKSVDGVPGLKITFHKGLNALIGENDSGKTAVIDALKLVLLTQSNEYIRPLDEDFYKPINGDACSEFKIDCTITEFTQNEAKNFIEYLKFKKNGEKIEYTLDLHYRAWREGHKIFQELRVGDVDDGISIDGKARDLLKAVYLKPLRDAEREMSSGRSSRISQILLNHPVFKDKQEHVVLDIFHDANKRIEDYFTNDTEGKRILQTIRDNLESFNDKGQASNAELKTSDIQLKAILESLSLNAPEINPGLGELNLLFIAAELLLLKDDTDGGMKLALIEELEAHLHPQAQLRLISYLQNEYNENDVQIIISTHSPILASKINLKNLILMKNGVGYDLAEGMTGLQKGDYLFLQRFLDSTKANLFFAKGIIMVEGDAENILIPVIADILGYPLEKYGVSIVNVGSTAFLRYSGIMVRKDGDTIGIPVSVITDCDVKPYDVDPVTKERKFNEKTTESVQAEKEKNEKYTNGSVRGFTSPRWTLEYCIAMSSLSKDFHKAVHYGMKILNAQEYISLTDEKITEADQAAKDEAEQWKDLSQAEIAYKIYGLMLNKDGKSSLKAIVAQCLASILRWEVSVIPSELTQEKMFDLDLYGLKTDEQKKTELKSKIERDQFLSYIVNAIKYAAGEAV